MDNKKRRFRKFYRNRIGKLMEFLHCPYCSQFGYFYLAFLRSGRQAELWPGETNIICTFIALDEENKSNNHIHHRNPIIDFKQNLHILLDFLYDIKK